MKKPIVPFVIAVLLLFGACNAPKTQEETVQEAEYTLAAPKPAWIEDRVRKAEARLNGSDAGQLVLKSINYHGGLTNWWSNGPLYFRFNYQPKPGTGVARDTYETADFWASRTRHQLVSNTSIEYGWDGEKSWHYPDTAQIPYDTRFWALTPYYFVGMPFVFADEGVNLVLEEDAGFEGQNYHIVRVTFGENVGDAPDDYYVLYIHPETYRLSAIRYIVSHATYFAEGQHSQEKLMTYEGEQKVGEITLPQKHRTFMWEADGTVGQYVTDILLTDLAFKPETPGTYFDAPEGSMLRTTLKSDEH